MDCHNRPAHRYHRPTTPSTWPCSLDQIDRDVALHQNQRGLCPDAVLHQRDAGPAEHRHHPAPSSYPNDPRIRPVIGAVQQIYKDNFFPEMKASWKVYPDNIGHKDWPGCFRCHDGLAQDRRWQAHDQGQRLQCLPYHPRTGPRCGAGATDAQGQKFKHPGDEVEGTAMIATPAARDPPLLNDSLPPAPTSSPCPPPWTWAGLLARSLVSALSLCVVRHGRGQEPQQRLPGLPLGQDADQDQAAGKEISAVRGRSPGPGVGPQDQHLRELPRGHD